MSFRGKVWGIIAVMMLAFWFLAYQSFNFVMSLIAMVIQ